MENGRAETDERGRNEDRGEAGTESRQHHSDKRKRHAEGERMWLRAPVGIDADDRLQQRRGDLTDERDEPDLPEAQAERSASASDRWMAEATASDR